MFGLLAFSLKAATPTSVTLQWNPSAETDVAGYRVHYGTTKGTYDRTVDAGENVTTSLNGLAAGTTYCFVVTAYNDSGIESLPSAEISHSAGVVSPLQLTLLPHSQVVTRGSTVTLSVGASGVEPLSYQWNKAGVAISGATRSSYTITNLRPAGTGAYSVTVVDNNSSIATPAVSVSTMQMQKPREIVIDGIPGANFAIAYSENLRSNLWTQAGTAALTSNQVRWVDLSGSNANIRFYRLSPVE